MRVKVRESHHGDVEVFPLEVPSSKAPRGLDGLRSELVRLPVVPEGDSETVRVIVKLAVK